jgi:hypothetical protein
MFNINTSHGCRQYLVDRRLSCRIHTVLLDSFHHQSQQQRRLARLFRETSNPILSRRADVLDERADQICPTMQTAYQKLLKIGCELIEGSNHIDSLLSQEQILDLLNVNTVDRGQVLPEDGLIEIAYTRGLEDSAMYRSEDFKKGPLAQAITAFMNHEVQHNENFKQSTHEFLFGKGGIFEFLPIYQQNENGEMVRMPPNLRLVDECDVQGTYPIHATEES